MKDHDTPSVRSSPRPMYTYTSRPANREPMARSRTSALRCGLLVALLATSACGLQDPSGLTSGPEESNAAAPSAPSGVLATEPRAPGSAHRLNAAFEAAAQEFRVPVDMLKAVSHAETRWIDHGAEPSGANGYGPMHLQQNEINQGLTHATVLLGLRPERLKADLRDNLRGGAALLATFYRQAWPDDSDMARADDLGRWFDPVARFLQSPVPEKAKDFADHVFSLLSGGTRVDFDDGTVVLQERGEITPEQGAFAGISSRAERLAQLGPTAAFTAPESGADAFEQSPSYTVASRGTGTITRVLIHACGGSYGSCRNTFLNPASGKSIHYLVRSDGYVLQMVHDKDIAYHTTGHNGYTVGIEHEGTANVTWWSDTAYRESAWVTAYRLFKYNLSASSTYIIGHNNVQATSCPGSTWNWNVYRNYAAQYLNVLKGTCQPGYPC